MSLRSLGRYWRPLLAVLIVGAVLVGLFLVAELGRSRLRDAAGDVHRGQDRSILVTDLLQVLTDAESAERGYLLTGEDRYLPPFSYAGERINALDAELVETYRDADPKIGGAVRKLQYLAGIRMGQMSAIITVYRNQGSSAALELQRAASQRQTMPRFRTLARALQRYEAAGIAQASARWRGELALAQRMNLTTLLASLALCALAVMLMIRGLRQQAAAAAALSRQRDQLETEVEARTAELTELYRHLQSVQEDERARLSRGLHDELGGLLLAARMDVTWLRQNVPADPPVLTERLARVQAALDRGIDLKRRVVEELRPTLLDNMGLVAALSWQIEETCARGNLKCVQHFPDDEPPLTRAASIALFRVVQEALLNVIKHARATEVEVHLEIAGDNLLLMMRDNGIGLPQVTSARSKAHGLAGMRHRVAMLGGQLEIDRAPGGGTEIRVIVPLAGILDRERTDSEPGEYPVLPVAGPGPANAS